MPPNIFFAGDVHGQLLSHVLRALEKTPLSERPAAIIYLGDLDPPSSLVTAFKALQDLGVEPWFIHGNHETDDADMWRRMVEVWDRNLHGRVVEIAGVKVAGLGGVFREKIWFPDCENPEPAKFQSYADFERDLHQRQGLKRRLEKLDRIRAQAIPSSLSQLMDPTKNGQLRKHSSTIFPDVVETLSVQEADVLVCHEAPSAHKNGFQTIDQLARAMHVKSLYHGHHHTDLDYGDTLGFQAYCVGYRGIRDLQGNVIKRGDYEK